MKGIETPKAGSEFQTRVHFKKPLSSLVFSSMFMRRTCGQNMICVSRRPLGPRRGREEGLPGGPGGQRPRWEGPAA